VAATAAAVVRQLTVAMGQATASAEVPVV